MLIPILCLSGYSDSETSDAAKASGIDRLVTKPCMPDDLLGHVHDLLRNARS
jgi:DNA-binding response OmpR family regulator